MTGNILQDRVRRILANTFNVPLEDIGSDTSSESLAQWDSLGQLVLILELEREFKLEVSPEQGEKLKSVSAITEMLYANAVAE